MCVVAIGDTSDRMTEDLNRRLRNVRVVVGGTRLPKVLEQPKPVFARLDIRFGLDASEIAELSEATVWTRSAA